MFRLSFFGMCVGKERYLGDGLRGDDALPLRARERGGRQPSTHVAVDARRVHIQIAFSIPRVSATRATEET